LFVDKEDLVLPSVKSRLNPPSVRFVSTMQILSRTHTPADCSETIVCHCLGISESAVADAVAICGLATVKDVCRETGAGSGCTACHARLRELVRKASQTVPVC
jgi:bacterioferritin-associated ferredoxin